MKFILYYSRNWIELNKKQYRPEELSEKFKTFINNHRLIQKLNQIYELIFNNCEQFLS
jgi:hypothetical protein